MCYLLCPIVRGVRVLTSDACGPGDPCPQMSASPWLLAFHRDPAPESRGACEPLTQLEEIIDWARSDHTLESLSDVATKQTSLCFVTSQARLPSNNLTCETGFVARNLANSAGGSGPEARWNGKLGASEAIV